MIEISQRNLSAGFVGGILYILFPVRLRGAEVELLFIFQRTQTNKGRRSSGCALINSPRAGRVSAGGRRNSTSPPGKDMARKRAASIAVPASTFRIQAGSAPWADDHIPLR